jgi:hypothetical protein
MDKVQKVNNDISLPSSRTFRSYTFKLMFSKRVLSLRVLIRNVNIHISYFLERVTFPVTFILIDLIASRK